MTNLELQVTRTKIINVRIKNSILDSCQIHNTEGIPHFPIHSEPLWIKINLKTVNTLHLYQLNMDQNYT